MKSKKLKIGIIALLIIILNLLIFSIVNGTVTVDGNTTINSLSAKAYENNNNEWWNFSPKDVLGKWLVSSGAAIDHHNAYCIDQHQKTGGNAGYEIVNIIDVINNTTNGKVKIYSESNKNGIEYNIDDSNVKPVLKFAYLARKATERGETVITVDPSYGGSNGGAAKYAMAKIMWDQTDFESLQKLGIDGRLKPTGAPTANYDPVTNDLNNAAIEANTISKVKFTDTTANKDTVTVTTNNGRTYIGPYKMTISNCKVANIEIKDNGTDKTASGISYDKSNILAVNELTSNKNFYIVVNGSVNKITKITVSSNTWEASRARIMLLYGEISQNFVIYKGEKYNDSRTIELPTPKFGNLQIKKIDSSTGEVLEGIGFKVYNYTTKKWLKIASTNGTISFVDKFEEATTLTTNNKGYANAQGLSTDRYGNPIINNLPYGKYLVYETKIPNSLSDYYEITTQCNVSNGEKITAKKMVTNETASNGLIELGAGQTIILTAENKKDFIPLQIEKKDEVSNLLSGIGFKIYSYAKQNWLKIDSNNKVSNYVSFDQATELITDNNGLTSKIDKVPVGKYMIVETNVGRYGDIYELGTFNLNGENLPGKIKKENYDVQANANNLVTITDTNKADYGKIQIQKVDEETNEPLQGVEFKIYSSNENGWLKTDANNRVVDYVTFDGATPFKTDANGKTPEINKVPIYKEDGRTKIEYSIYETNLPEELDKIYELGTMTVPNPGTNEPKKAKLSKTITIKTPIGINTPVQVEKATNKQEYISLSGYVWEDIPGNYDNKTESTRNNLYDEPDYLINGIRVVLKDKNSGNVVKNGDEVECITTTSTVNGKNGFYRFEKVYIDKLSDYYVEFEYDGIVYQNVLIDNINNNESSKAKETDANRNKFNNAYSEITGEGQEITNLNEEKVELKYNKSKVHDEVLNADITDVTLSNSFKKSKENQIIKIGNNGDSYNNGYTSYPIFATTNAAGLDLNDKYEELKSNNNNIVTEIENINLGLYEREKTDLYVGKDLYSVKLSINGFNHIYKYGYKPDEYYNKKNASFNVGVEFMKEKGISRYTRPIYKSDADYINNADKNKELKTYITYKISMVNDTTSLTTKVNSLVDYFDSRYNTEGVKVGTTYNDETGEVTDELKVASIEKYNDKYNKMIIETNAEMEAKESQDIYVRFELSREQVAEILKGEEGNAPIDNVVEVNSYTTLKDGKIYASIDKDSIPANADPSKTTGEGNNETYEDDTDIAPTLVLTPFDDRTMSGIVFEDNAISQGKGNVRQGNGVYDEGEKAVKGVTVVMTQVDKDGNEVKDENGNIVKYTAEPTNNEGSFTISNYIPGYYKITYTWGKDQGGYDVKDFKATIFNKDAHQGTAWYKNETTRYSDAMDDYGLRLH